MVVQYKFGPDGSRSCSPESPPKEGERFRVALGKDAKFDCDYEAFTEFTRACMRQALLPKLIEVVDGWALVELVMLRLTLEDIEQMRCDLLAQALGVFNDGEPS